MNAAGPQRIWALVPVKRFDRAKSRLTPLFNQSRRIALARAMLSDVLAALAKVEVIAGVLVVSDDLEAIGIAKAHGAIGIADPPEEGLNAAVRHGMHWLAALPCEGVVVVPADIPFVTPAELHSVVEVVRTNQVVIVPASRDGGTNILAVMPPLLLSPMFGDESFARHVAATLVLAVSPQTLVLQGAGHDIDVAADLETIPPVGPGAHTRACLGCLASGHLRMAPASCAGLPCP